MSYSPILSNLTTWLSELSLLLQSGQTLPQALDLLRHNQDNPVTKRVAEQTYNAVQQGQSFAEGLRAHSTLFPSNIVDLIATAEQKNQLAETLNDIVSYRENIESSQADLFSHLVGTLTYYVIILSIVLALGAVLLVFVIPEYGIFYAEFGADLPQATQNLLIASKFFVAGGWLLPVVLVVALFILIWLPWGRDRLLRYTPFVAGAYRNLVLAQALLTSAFWFKQQQSLAECLKAAAQAIAYAPEAQKFARASELVSNGSSITEACQQVGLPNSVVRTASVGEQSQQLDVVWHKLANSYQRQASVILEPASKYLGIVLAILMGLLVGYMVFAVYMPLFQIGEIA